MDIAACFASFASELCNYMFTRHLRQKMSKPLIIKTEPLRRPITQGRGRRAVTITLAVDELELLAELVKSWGRASTKSQVAAACFRRGLVELCKAEGVGPDLVRRMVGS